MKRRESPLMRGCHIVVALAIASGIAADAVHAQQTESREHLVKSGDTLWELARLYLANPYLWPLIYEVNKGIVENPHRIFPTERLIIPALPGEEEPVGGPVLLGVPVPFTFPQVPSPQAPVAAEETPVTYTQSPRTRFYRPRRQGLNELAVQSSAPARVSAAEYHATPWISDTLALVAQVFRPTDPRMAGDRMHHTFHPYSQLIAGYMQPRRPTAGERFLVVHLGREIEGWGRVVEPRGVVRVDSLFETTLVATITHEFGSLSTGDYLIPLDSFRVPTAAPEEIRNGPEGFLIDVKDRQPLVGTHDVAFVSLGSIQDLKVGDEVLAIVPELIPDRSRPEMLPKQGIARMLVTKVRERTATVRVLSLEHAALVPGLPVRVVARMSQ